MESGQGTIEFGKHGVDFAEASTVFGDPFEYTVSDPDHPDCCMNCRVLASSGGVQYCESMSEFSFSTFVAVHGEDQLAGWANDAPGTLDEGTTKGPNLPEAPQCGALCGRATGTRVELDLELASQVVSRNAGEHVQLN